MGNALALMGFGAFLFALCFIGAAPTLFGRRLPKSKGYLRGEEIGLYFGMGLGAVLFLSGVAAALWTLIA